LLAGEPRRVESLPRAPSASRGELVDALLEVAGELLPAAEVGSGGDDRGVVDAGAVELRCVAGERAAPLVELEASAGGEVGGCGVAGDVRLRRSRGVLTLTFTYSSPLQRGGFRVRERGFLNRGNSRVRAGVCVEQELVG